MHVNGLVRRADGLHLWIARRSRTKQLDPGKLDHIVAGGVPAGLSPAQTVGEGSRGVEAAVPRALAGTARRVGLVRYAMERPERGCAATGCIATTLAMPEDFIPRAAADGEVEFSSSYRPIERALATVRQTNDFKFNVNLVLIDLFLRERLIWLARLPTNCAPHCRTAGV